MRKKYVFNLTNLFFQTSPEKTVYLNVVTKIIFYFIPFIVGLFTLKYVLNAKFLIYDKTFMAPKTYVCK